jgi:hypothetical protein
VDFCNALLAERLRRQTQVLLRKSVGSTPTECTPRGGQRLFCIGSSSYWASPSRSPRDSFDLHPSSIPIVKWQMAFPALVSVCQPPLPPPPPPRHRLLCHLPVRMHRVRSSSRYRLRPHLLPSLLHPLHLSTDCRPSLHSAPLFLRSTGEMRSGWPTRCHACPSSTSFAFSTSTGAGMR